MLKLNSNPIKSLDEKSMLSIGLHFYLPMTGFMWNIYSWLRLFIRNTVEPMVIINSVGRAIAPPIILRYIALCGTGTNHASVPKHRAYAVGKVAAMLAIAHMIHGCHLRDRTCCYPDPTRRVPH